MNDNNYNYLTNEEIYDLDIRVEEKLEIVLKKLNDDQRKIVCDAWENSKFADNFMFPFGLRDESLLKRFIQVLLSNDDITVSNIQQMYHLEPSKLEFEVHDYTTNTIYDIDLFSFTDMNVFNTVFRHACNYIFPRFGDDVRKIFSIFICSKNPFGGEAEQPSYTFYNQLIDEDEIEPTDPEELEKFNAEKSKAIKDFKRVYDAYYSELIENEDIKNLIGFIYDGNPRDELTKDLADNFIKVKKDKMLQLDFTLKYIKYILRLM